MELTPKASGLEAALSRFDSAIEALIATVERAKAAPAGHGKVSATRGDDRDDVAAAHGDGARENTSAVELTTLRDDHARLVGEVKGLRERNGILVETNAQAIRGIGEAMDTIRAVLGDAGR
ncbi:MAG: hypothetical protein V6Z86_08615 [Hyphomicrobiales bacterium]